MRSKQAEQHGSARRARTLTRHQMQSGFRRAMASYKGGRVHDAASQLRDVVCGGSTDPRHLSFCGLLMATVEGRMKEGLALCQEALQLGFSDPDVYLNLARLYSLSGQRKRAVSILRKGIHAVEGHAGIISELDRLSPRSAPLNTLHRDNVLNKNLGKLRAWFQQKILR